MPVCCDADDDSAVGRDGVADHSWCSACTRHNSASAGGCVARPAGSLDAGTIH